MWVRCAVYLRVCHVHSCMWSWFAPVSWSLSTSSAAPMKSSVLHSCSSRSVSHWSTIIDQPLSVFTPHQSTSWLWPIAVDGVAWSVCLLVCLSWEPCRNGWTDRNAVRNIDSDGPKEPRIKWESRSRLMKQRPPQYMHRHVCRLVLIQCGCWLGVLDGLHIGAAWRIRLHHPWCGLMSHYSERFESMHAY